MSEISEIMGVPELVDYLRSFPVECALGSIPVTEVFDRYHVPEHVVVSDDVVIDRDALVAHAAGSRKRVVNVSVDVMDALVDFPRVAARYVLRVEMRRGLTVATEIHAFGRLAPDRRFIRIDQVTRALAPRS